MTRDLDSFLDGDRTKADFSQVSDWLRSDESHVSVFVDQLQIEEDLRRLSLHDDVGRFVGGRKHSLVRGEGTPKSGSGSWTRRGLALFALACTMMLMVFAAEAWRTASIEVVASAPAKQTPETAIVATLGDVENCDWKVATYASGQHFTAGTTLSLLSGIAQLSFDTGAVLVLQGPCEVNLEENAVDLSDGRVSAMVPKSAFGFAVRTPSSEVIDLGTEFGVSFDETDGTQVHVFSGEVVTRARNEQGDMVGESLFVTTHNAIHFRPGTDNAERFEADEDAFVRWLSDQHPPISESPPPVSGELSLWLTSDHWMLDDAGRVNVWRDAVSSWNHLPDNALQANPAARPAVVQGAIGGLPAVRFDGVDDCLITTPITNADSQTIAFVVSIRKGGHENGQIINYNGPPQRITWRRKDPNILQIVARADGKRHAHVRPFVYLGHAGQRSLRVGEIDSGHAEQERSLPAIDEPFVAVYVYDRTNNRAELCINGRSVGVATAPAAIGFTSRKVIGRHGGYADYFSGDLSEVLIYNEGLDAAKVQALSESLAAKYSIQL